jgi:hypothetical protein
MITDKQELTAAQTPTKVRYTYYVLEEWEGGSLCLGSDGFWRFVTYAETDDESEAYEEFRQVVIDDGLGNPLRAVKRFCNFGNI